MQIIVMMPVFNDWDSSSLLCASIDATLKQFQSAIVVDILLVDDGSANVIKPDFLEREPEFLNKVSVLTLRRNVGHQRAIAIGLTYIQQHCQCDAVVVMDADGEDRAEDIPRLIHCLAENKVATAVFAERRRRMEGPAFKAFYEIYRLLHYLLTGRTIRVGNFSALPRRHLDALVAFPELWNHYAAAVMKSRLRYTTIQADRAQRICGRSQMNFVALVIHGCSALFTFHEIVSTRLLIASGAVSAAFCLLLAAVLLTRFFTNLAIPGWASIVSGLLFLVIIQLLATSISVVFSAMISRNALGFIPLRDYVYFVSGCENIYSR
jgi:polyisoprenyl-phosphate glycosyltransferase